MAKKSKLLRRLRRRLEPLADRIVLSEWASALLARYIRRCHARVDWTFHGHDALAEHVRSGQPVVIVLWHGRLPMAPLGWDPDWGALCVVTSAARPGRLVGNVMRRFDQGTLPINDRKTDTASVLQVARMAREGVSIGLAVDGPSGPPHHCKAVPIDWTRLTGLPVWLYTFSAENYRRLKTWDDMAVPRPGRGCMLYRRWDGVVPKKLDADTRESLRLKLQQDLDALSLEADRMMGHEKLIN